MKFIKIIPAILILFVLGIRVSAQLSVQFQPGIHGRDVQGLAYVHFLNSSENVCKIALLIRITDTKAGEGVRIKTGSFIVRPGIGPLDRAAFANATFLFAKNSTGSIIQQSGKLPEGEYEFCFDVEVLETKDPRIPPSFERCYLERVHPLTPFILISPSDGDQLCNKRPDFSGNLRCLCCPMPGFG